MAVLCVRLARWADNNPDGVAGVKDGLDELAAAIPEEIDVTRRTTSQVTKTRA